ncbi:S8 family serine peptidase [Microbacterium sp. CIAB417]|uniref:S8 family peptidase n=1 Tax=Microbacterium sp. CIAB417 TaxID=2860287 RepID=UPI001FAC5421|nr:S8 family serine peptidase [Microbacterium sp. CIAB417]
MVVSRMRWVRAGAVAAVGLVGVLALGAVPASASDDGQWWYDAYKVADVHAEGWTGEGVKIAVVDSQINPELPDFAGADLTVAPGAACEGVEPSTTEANAESEHGSTVTAMLIGNGTGVAGTKGIVPDASVTFYGVGALEDCTPTSEVEGSGHTPLGWMLQRALDDGADIVMTAIVQGQATIPDLMTVAEAVASKTPFVAGNPNDGFKQGGLPAGLSGVVGVSAVDRDGNLPIAALGVENAILDTTVVAPGVGISTLGDNNSWDDPGLGTGTSLATPQVAGMLAVAMQKYPDATGNQLIQALVNNAGSGDQPASYDATDGYGYGAASLTGVLAADPSQYADTNPLLDKVLQLPSAEQIAAAEEALISPDSVGQPASTDPGGIAALLPVFIGVGVGVLALIVVGVVVTVVLVRRSRRRVGA